MPCKQCFQGCYLAVRQTFPLELHSLNRRTSVSLDIGSSVSPAHWSPLNILKLCCCGSSNVSSLVCEHVFTVYTSAPFSLRLLKFLFCILWFIKISSGLQSERQVIVSVRVPHVLFCCIWWLQLVAKRPKQLQHDTVLRDHNYAHVQEYGSSMVEKMLLLLT